MQFICSITLPVPRRPRLYILKMVSLRLTLDPCTAAIILSRLQSPANPIAGPIMVELICIHLLKAVCRSSSSSSRSLRSAFLQQIPQEIARELCNSIFSIAWRRMSCCDMCLDYCSNLYHHIATLTSPPGKLDEICVIVDSRSDSHA